MITSSALNGIVANIPLDTLVSTQGIMVMLLVAYAGAMWAFLRGAPKVHTVMVSDVEVARRFYEGMLSLSAADVPLHYYYNYEQTLGTAGIDPMMGASSFGHFGGPHLGGFPEESYGGSDGLWYQLKKNTQLHVIGGASLGNRNRQRHVCFDHDCLEYLLMQVQTRGIRHKLRRDRPLNFLVKDFNGEVIEMAEVEN
ncbi:glyoxalase-like domain protein [Synechococcus sp. PCC 7335]|uniref:glyoxalase-like domain protein n=1 Tax=Synechococcus sp. (strain ATCC 29403 / PCC 7335) TaxID=91464 RepID=UPI000570699B|nr:glyoxalase-like domain protein [Synechococcus sp. PCC 7335]